MPDKSPAAAPPSDDIEPIVARARIGDIRAWDLIVRRHQEVVFRVVFMLTNDATAATDATRSTFMRAYPALPDLPAGTPILPWLLSTVAQVARAQRRFLDRADEDESRGLELPPGPRKPATPVIGLAQAAALHPDLRDQLRAGFGLLTAEERLAIAARYLVGLNRADAAKLLNTEQAMVERSLQSALRHLRSTQSDPAILSLPSDHLGWLSTATIVGQLRAIPDVAPEVAERLIRDAVTYPEQLGSARRMQVVAGMAAIQVEGGVSQSQASRR
jgi:RNA polymerase sigma-70 factor (ECF subfamily)